MGECVFELNCTIIRETPQFAFCGIPSSAQCGVLHKPAVILRESWISHEANGFAGPAGRPRFQPRHKNAASGNRRVAGLDLLGFGFGSSVAEVRSGIIHQSAATCNESIIQLSKNEAFSEFEKAFVPHYTYHLASLRDASNTAISIKTNCDF